MKKFIISLFVVFSFSYADIIQENINLVKQQSHKQDLLANSIEYHIHLYGVVPSDITVIQGANLLSNVFSFSGSFSVDTSNKTITITSTIAGSQQYQKDFFLNDFDRSRAVTPSVSGDNFTTLYNLDIEAIRSYQLQSGSIAEVQPTAPTIATGKVWMKSDTRELFIYYGAWKSLSPKELYVVRSTGELPTAVVENTGAFVHTGTSLSKHLYLNGAWRTIPQSIPFTYNSGF